MSLMLKPSRSSRRDSLSLVAIGTLVMLITLAALFFVAPFGFIVLTSLKSTEQLADPSRPLLPMSPKTYVHEGKTLSLYNVTIDGKTRELALLESARSGSTLLDPTNPTGAPIKVPTRAINLEKAMVFDPRLDVYQQAIARMDFPLALLNTLFVVVCSTVGAVISSALVAYGFSRFRIPGANILFFILLSTIILPPQVTLIPTFVIFSRIGWYPSLLPLIVPHFFANAYNVFLLRQYFLTIPVEMDEAARVDGATPLQTFLWVILPQSRAALLTVTLFHFLYTWSEFYMASIFTGGRPEYSTLSVSLQRFFQFFGNQPNQLMAGVVLVMLPPLVIYFLAQRHFMQSIVITGVDK